MWARCERKHDNGKDYNGSGAAAATRRVSALDRRYNAPLIHLPRDETRVMARSASSTPARPPTPMPRSPSNPQHPPKPPKKGDIKEIKKDDALFRIRGPIPAPLHDIDLAWEKKGACVRYEIRTKKEERGEEKKGNGGWVEQRTPRVATKIMR
jgi:hypothetical protein